MDILPWLVAARRMLSVVRLRTSPIRQPVARLTSQASRFGGMSAASMILTISSRAHSTRISKNQSPFLEVSTAGPSRSSREAKAATVVQYSKATASKSAIHWLRTKRRCPPTMGSFQSKASRAKMASTLAAWRSWEDAAAFSAAMAQRSRRSTAKVSALFNPVPPLS